MATMILAGAQFYKNTSWIAQLAMMAGASYIDSKLFGPKTTVGKMDDLKIQSSTFGVPLSKVYGKSRVAGNIIWGTKFVSHKESSGGKGGGGATTYKYSVSFAVAICKGPIKGINKVWADGNPMPLYKSDFSLSRMSGTSSAFTWDSKPVATETTTWYLQVKLNSENAQVLSVTRASSTNTYPDAYFGTYYDNGILSFQIDLAKTVTTGTKYKLVVKKETVKYTYSLHLGTEDQEPDSFIEGIEGIGNVPAYRGLAYIVIQNMYTTQFGNRIPQLSFEVETAQTVLSDVVKDVCTNAGLDADTSDLSSVSITGQTVEMSQSYRDMITPLSEAYLFDGIEQNGKLVFSRRNVFDALPILYDYLGAHESSNADEALKFSDADELELPKQFTLTYTSSDFDYQDMTATAKRSVTNSTAAESASLKVVLSDIDAKALAEKKLYEIWINSRRYTLALANYWAFLLPGQVIIPVDSDGNKQAMVVTKANYGMPGLNKIEAMAISDVIYSSVDRSADSNDVLSDFSSPEQVNFEFMDLPKLPGDNNTNVIYWVAASDKNDTGYEGANVYKTTDGGNSYNLVAQTTKAATIGYTSGVLSANGPVHYFDNKNTIDIVLESGSISSNTMSAVFNGANTAIIGNEVIQFLNATLIDTDTFRLSGLLRGRLGTEDQMSTHADGERFVLLTAGTLNTMTSTTDDWYKPLSLKVGPILGDVGDATYLDTTFTNNARFALPWPVCHVERTIDDSGNSTIRWSRRTRYGGDWLDNSDVPLNEEKEWYMWYIFNSSNKCVVFSAATTNSFTLSADTLRKYIGSTSQKIKIQIRQVSPTRGNGLVKEVTI